MIALKHLSLWLFAAIFPSQAQWTGWGGNLFNNRWASASLVDSANADKLTQHCKLDIAHGVSAAPAIQGTIAYFPAWDGSFVAYDYVQCKVVWEVNVTAITYGYGAPNAFQAAVVFPGSRTSPQIDPLAGVLYFGTILHALLVAVDLGTGKVLGHTQINPHPLAVATMSPTLYGGKIFIGTASDEESAATNPSYPCCSFIGNFAAFTFNRASGKFNTAWNVTMLPPPYGPGQWSGAGVWGSQPSIDILRNQVFIATGNVYGRPARVQSCISASGNNNETGCYPSTVYSETVIALDINTGRVNWVKRLSALDAWTLACGLSYFGVPNQPTCPPNPGLDADFGMAPTFVSGLLANTPSHADVVITGQKNGIIYAMDAGTGKLYWATLAAPDPGATGALIWGLAVDLSRVYFTAYEAGGISWKLQPSGQTITNNAYGALNLANGSILWETQAPDNAVSFAPPTVTNDLVLVGQGEPDGALLAYNKATGKLVRSIPTDQFTYGGVAVQGTYVMFGTGYTAGTVAGTGSFYVYNLAL